MNSNLEKKIVDLLFSMDRRDRLKISKHLQKKIVSIENKYKNKKIDNNDLRPSLGLILRWTRSKQ